MAAQLMEPAKKLPTHGSAAPDGSPTATPPVDAVVRRLTPEDQALLDKLLSEPADYVNHPDFDGANAEQDLFGNEAQLTSRSATRFDEPVEVPERASSGARLPTLSHAQEVLLFKRFNFARRRVAEILERFAGRRLTAPAARALLAWGHRVLDARGTIVRLNMPLVLAMAKRTRLHNIDFNEFVSEGNMALLRSVEKFDCGRGFKFSTYSCRAILKSFSRVAMRASRYRGRFPTEFDASMERSDFVDRKREDVEADCVDELKDILLENLAGLSEVERVVINARFAIGCRGDQARCAPKTLEQVGQIIGVTKERVRQIQNKALRKIRTTLEERYLAA